MLPWPVCGELAVRALRIGFRKILRGITRGTRKFLELGRRQRRTEVKALILIAAERLQELELLGAIRRLPPPPSSSSYEPAK